MKVEAFLLKIRRLIDSLLYIGLIFGVAGISNTGFTVCHQPPAVENVVLSAPPSNHDEITEIVEAESFEIIGTSPTETINIETMPIVEVTEPIALEMDAPIETECGTTADVEFELEYDMEMSAEASAEFEAEPVQIEAEPIIFKRHGAYFKEADQTMYVTRNVNVRSGPGMSHGIIGGLAEGESVAIIAIGIGANRWNRIVYENSTGYVYSEYLSYEPTFGN